jgi:hypothetical protein
MNRWTGLSLVGLIVLPVLLLGKSMSPGKVLATSGTEDWLPWRSTATPDELALPQMTKDTVRENIPYRIFLHRCISQGQLPWWSPYSYCGIPYLALNHTQVLYPPSLIAAFFDPYSSYGALIMVHMIIAGLLMFWFLSQRGCSTAAAFFGGMTFMLNGMFVTRHGHPQFIASGCWLPLLFIGVNDALQHRWPRSMAILAAGTVMSILAGHPSVYVYGLYFVLVYFACRLMFIERNITNAIRIRSGLTVFAGVALGLGLASTQLLATWELSRFSLRSARPFEELAARMPHWSVLFRMIFPDFNGSEVKGNYWSVTALSTYTATTLYTGLLPLIVGVYGGIRKGTEGRLILGLAAGTLGIIFIEPVYELVYLLVPGFKFSRVDRLLIVFFFCVAYLAALGLDCTASMFTARQPQTRRAQWRFPVMVAAGSGMCAIVLTTAANLTAAKLLTGDVFTEFKEIDHAMMRGHLIRGGILICCTGAWFSLASGGWMRRRWGIGLLLVLGGLDLYSFGGQFVIVRPADRIFRATSATDFLANIDQPFRIAKFHPREGGPDLVLPSNTPMAYGFQELQGFGPMHLMNMDALLSGLDDQIGNNPWRLRAFAEESAMDSDLLDLLNVRFVLSASPLSAKGLHLIHQQDLWIYENPNTLPRAQFIKDHQVVKKQEAAIRMLTQGLSNPRELVLLDRAPNVDGWPKTTESEEDQVDLVAYDLDRIVVQKKGPSGGFVRLSDAYYPGWRATVDGQDVEVFQADVCFRAVPVGPGEHEIVFEYRPTYLTTAGVATTGSGCALGVIGFFAWRRRRIALPATLQHPRH